MNLTQQYLDYIEALVPVIVSKAKNEERKK
jgi:hypothetical protein